MGAERYGQLIKRVSLALPKSNVTSESPTKIKVSFNGTAMEIILGAKAIASLQGVRAIHGLDPS